MSLATRLAATLLVPVVLLVVVLAWEVSLVNRLQEDNQQLVEVSLAAGRLLTVTRKELDELDEFTRRFWVFEDPDYAAELSNRRQGIARRLESLAALDLGGPVRAQQRHFSSAYREYRQLAAELDQRVLDEASLTPSEQGELEAAYEPAADDLTVALTEFESVLREAVDQRLETSAVRARRARRLALIAAVGAVAAALLTALLFGRSVARGLVRLARGTREIAGGHFGHRVPEAGSEELASLARDFNSMAVQLGELDRLKRDFVSSVSHDLKAPLASMQETTRLLLDGTVGDLNDKQDRLLRLTLASNERLSSMIGDLLDLARLEAGAMEFEPEQLDLAQVAARTIDEVTSLLESRQIEVDFKPTRAAPIRADPQWLARALWNLLSNAAKFSPVGSRLEVRVVAAGDGLEQSVPERVRGSVAPELACFSLADSGPGIPDDEKERIFERFQRSNRVRRDGSGTGLGLAITREVIERHDGAVWVEDAPGRGSLFWLVLPLRQESREA